MWATQTSPRFVDTNANYWHIDFTANPGVTFTISGTYPSDRYTSYAVYTTTYLTNFSELEDVVFPPNPGSVNPLLAGTARGTGTYTVHLMIGPTPPTPAPGTIYADVPPSTTMRLYYRVYLPDSGATPSGNVPLPAVRAYNSSNGAMVGCPPPTTPWSPIPPGFKPHYGTFYREPAGFFPNNDSAYLNTSLAPFTNTPNAVYVIRFPAPTTPHTLAGQPIDMTTQLRYWSACAYRETGIPFACLPDEVIPVSQTNQVTLVLGQTGAQPSNATAANGIQWMDLGPFTATVGVYIRQTLPAPSFTQSAFAVPMGKPVSPYMGSYAPTISRCSTAQFEANFCAPTATPTATAVTTPTATATPTDTATDTVTPTPSDTVTATATDTPTDTATATPSAVTN